MRISQKISGSRQLFRFSQTLILFPFLSNAMLCDTAHAPNTLESPPSLIAPAEKSNPSVPDPALIREQALALLAALKENMAAIIKTQEQLKAYVTHIQEFLEQEKATTGQHSAFCLQKIQSFAAYEAQQYPPEDTKTFFIGYFLDASARRPAGGDKPHKRQKR